MVNLLNAMMQLLHVPFDTHPVLYVPAGAGISTLDSGQHTLALIVRNGDVCHDVLDRNNGSILVTHPRTN